MYLTPRKVREYASPFRDCGRDLARGFAAQGKGVESLADAANEGEKIRIAAD